MMHGTMALGDSPEVRRMLAQGQGDVAYENQQKILNDALDNTAKTAKMK